LNALRLARFADGGFITAVSVSVAAWEVSHAKKAPLLLPWLCPPQFNSMLKTIPNIC
jgi:hypothetical protein